MAANGDGKRLLDSVVGLRAHVPDEAVAEGPVTVGIRPEHIILGRGDRDARTMVVESLGNEQIVTLDIGGQELVARSTDGVKLHAGETVRWGLNTDKLHYFCPKGGQRVNRGEGSAA